MAGLSCLVLVLAALWLVRQAEPTIHHGPGLDAGADVPVGEATALVRRLEDAVVARDGEALPAIAVDPRALHQLRGIVDNARALDVVDFSARYVDETGTRGGLRGTWSAVIDLTWRFAGFDHSIARSEVVVTFATTADGLALKAVGGSGRRTPVWLSGPVHAVTSGRVLVLARESRAVAVTVATQARRALPVVQAGVPAWRGPIVIEVPESTAAVEAALDAEVGTHRRTGAVTASVDGRSAAPVHVFINPQMYDEQSLVGRQLVLTHELAHVATGAASSRAPLWLVEGFADHVALRGTGLPMSKTLAHVASQVRPHGVPDELPGPTALGVGADGIRAAYESAWVACEVVVDHLGEEALATVYREASAGRRVGAILKELGWSRVEHLMAWRGELRKAASTEARPAG